MHITSSKAWREAQRRGVYTANSLETEGFIHFSKPDQVIAVANSSYHGQKDLVLLCVLPEKLMAELRYEALGTNEAYPHLYGPLNLGAVVNVVVHLKLMAPSGSRKVLQGRLLDPLEMRKRIVGFRPQKQQRVKA